MGEGGTAECMIVEYLLEVIAVREEEGDAEHSVKEVVVWSRFQTTQESHNE